MRRASALTGPAAPEVLPRNTRRRTPTAWPGPAAGAPFILNSPSDSRAVTSPSAPPKGPASAGAAPVGPAPVEGGWIGTNVGPADTWPVKAFPPNTS